MRMAFPTPYPMRRYLLHAVLLLLSSSPSALIAGDHLRLPLRRLAAPSDLTRLDQLRGMMNGDRHRQLNIAGKMGKKLPACAAAPDSEGEAAMEMPVWSGAYTGTGQYFVRVRLGTPAQSFLLVPDTGSDLTWVNCKHHAGNSSASGLQKRRSRRVFQADRSRSFFPISCSSDTCRTGLPFSLTTCPTPSSPCQYDYQYAEGSSAQGFFANESATVELLNRRRIKLRGLVLGCTSTAVGSSFVSSDGVLALGSGPNTFVSRAAGRFSGRFSYCLVDHLSPRNATGHLTFGLNPDLPPESPSAPLFLQPAVQPFYFVAVSGISVAGELLSIPSSVWNYSSGGGAIVDSGTTLTFFAEPAYNAVVSAVNRRIQAVPRLQIDPFEYCYNWTSPEAKSAGVPDLTVHFVGSAKISPPAKSYLIDVADGVKCIGISSAPSPGVSTIGNIFQQEHIWEFDLKNKRLRFHRSNCTEGYFRHW